MLPERVVGCLSEPGQLVADRRDRVLGEEGGEFRFDAVDGGDKEVGRAHRQVRDPEVEERVRGASLVASAEQRADPRQVRIDGGFERGVEQMLDRELLGEVRAGRLALPGLVVDVDMSPLGRRPRRQGRPGGTSRSRPRSGRSG